MDRARGQHLSSEAAPRGDMSFHSDDNDTYLSILGTGVMLKDALGILVHDDYFINPQTLAGQAGCKELN